MAQVRGNALLSKKRKYSATTSDNHFDFARSDDDFEELAKGFQPKNTKVYIKLLGPENLQQVG